jgi:ABC-type Fe3+/spermidine/putrescine transport system ATPase subunit
MTLRTGAEVRLEGIGKRYGAVQAVKPLDLVIESGTLVTLLGPSGCGKTTLLRMIAGLEQSTEGRLFIGGRDVTLLPAGGAQRLHGLSILRPLPTHERAGERRLRPRLLRVP